MGYWICKKIFTFSSNVVIEPLKMFFLSVVLLDIMSEHRRKAAQVVVIATAESRQNVHLELLQSKGEHAFENILEIAPPSLVKGDTRF